MAFQAGVSGNPAGRPSYSTITEAYRRLLQNGGAEKLAAVIFQDALTAKRAQDRRMAAQEITDRVEGRAIQAVRLETGLDADTARAIAGLAAIFAPQANVIDLGTGANRPLLEPPQGENAAQQNQQVTGVTAEGNCATSTLDQSATPAHRDATTQSKRKARTYTRRKGTGRQRSKGVGAPLAGVDGPGPAPIPTQKKSKAGRVSPRTGPISPSNPDKVGEVGPEKSITEG